MGFHETDRNAHGMVFFRCARDHHAIGLKPGKDKTRRPEAKAGLNVEHLAMEVDNTDILLAARDFLKANNIPIVFEGRKGAGCNIGINFLDPDGYEFEIYCQIDQIDESGRLRPKEQFRRAGNLEEAIANPVPKTW
jgi:catechol 2,3-dioxygenase-like lactoylglutathione lyase family enzyme